MLWHYDVKYKSYILGIIGKNTIVKSALANNNLDKATKGGLSISDWVRAYCLVPVWCCQCICTHSVAWCVVPVQSAPCWGEGAEATPEAAPCPCPAHNPWTRGNILTQPSFSIIQHINITEWGEDTQGVPLLHRTVFSVCWVLPSDYCPGPGRV